MSGDKPKVTDHKGQVMCATNGQSVEEVRRGQTNETGQHFGYIVLCEEERQKGFVRPYRDAYKHVGRSICAASVLPPNGNVGRWTVKVCNDDFGHEGDCGIQTREVSADQFNAINQSHRVGGCGSVTTMGRALSETYARDPKFYGATFCCRCNRHLPVAEFVWTADGQQVGS